MAMDEYEWAIENVRDGPYHRVDMLLCFVNATARNGNIITTDVSCQLIYVTDGKTRHLENAVTGEVPRYIDTIHNA